MSRALPLTVETRGTLTGLVETLESRIGKPFELIDDYILTAIQGIGFQPSISTGLRFGF